MLEPPIDVHLILVVYQELVIIFLFFYQSGRKPLYASIVA